MKYIDHRYTLNFMIRSFSDKRTQAIYDGVKSKHARQIPLNCHPKAQRLLDQINAATKLQTLKIPPGNNLEQLHGDLTGFWSIRLNKQWRIIFRWDFGDAFDVKIVDYH